MSAISHYKAELRFALILVALTALSIWVSRYVPDETIGSSSQNCMAVSDENYWERKYFIWDAAGHVLTSDSYAARYLSYSSGAWYGETYPASASYPAAMFSFYVQVP